MKLYFEDYKYRIESLRENLSDRFYVYNKKRTHGYITHVGYYYNYNAAKPEKSDSVFILPKLFIESVSLFPENYSMETNACPSADRENSGAFRPAALDVISGMFKNSSCILVSGMVFF